MADSDMGFENENLFSSDDIGFEADDDINLEDGELTGLHTVKAPKRSARERMEARQGVRRDRLGRPETGDADGDMVAPVRGVRISGSGSAAVHAPTAPMRSESSEFGYLFSDDEPDDTHMDQSNVDRLAALAYDERQDGDGEQYADIFEKSNEPMVRRRAFNKRSSGKPAEPTETAVQPAQESSGDSSSGMSGRFSRRSRAQSKEEPAPAPEPAVEETVETSYAAEPAAYEQTAYETPAGSGSSEYDTAAQGEQPVVYGAYPQPYYPYSPYPAAYPQPYVPQQPYGYMPPQQPYPQPYAQPYNPYMPVPSYAPPIVVIPPMGYYYDMYDDEDMPVGYRRGRRRRAERHDDRDERPSEPAQAQSAVPAPVVMPAAAPEPESKPEPKSEPVAKPEPKEEPAQSVSAAQQVYGPAKPEQTETEHIDRIEDAPPAPRFRRRTDAPASNAAGQSDATDSAGTASHQPDPDSSRSEQPSVGSSRFNRRSGSSGGAASTTSAPVSASSQHSYSSQDTDGAPSGGQSKFRRRSSGQ